MVHNFKKMRIIPAIMAILVLMAAIIFIWRPYQLLRKSNQQQILLNNELQKQKENFELSRKLILQLKNLKHQFSPLFDRPFSTKRSDQVIQYFLDITKKNNCFLHKTDITLLKNQKDEGFHHHSNLSISLTSSFFNLYQFLVQAASSPWPFIVKQLILSKASDDSKNTELNLDLQLEVFH